MPKELEGWTSDFNLPSSVWLPGFFNPQSFLTAIMQSTARKNELPLDKMCLTCEVTKKQAGEMQSNKAEGAYTHGLFMEGARWDIAAGYIAESNLKELYPSMPVMYIKAVTQDKQETRNFYECPVYKTRQRGVVIRIIYLSVSSRSHLHMDLQSEDKGEIFKVGFGRSCSFAPDLISFSCK